MFDGLLLGHALTGRVALGFFIALVVALSATPWVRRLALNLGALDVPGGRSMHKQPVPYLGGVAIYLGFAVTLAVLNLLSTPAVQGILIAGFIILIVGVVDDIYALRPISKLIGQIGAALVLIPFGVTIDRITNPFGGMIELGVWAFPLTIFWVIAFANVLNLADGLDGLAAGIAAIASLTLLVAAIRTQQGALAILLTSALAGSCLGFLPFNFNPAKIFMGDAGAMFLGFTLAAVSVEGSLKSPAMVAVIVPVLAVGLPIFDTVMAILRRVRRGQPIGQGDREHLHHRLLQLGFSHREVVLFMYFVSGWLGLSAMLLTEIEGPLALALVVMMLIGFIGGGRLLLKGLPQSMPQRRGAQKES